MAFSKFVLIAVAAFGPSAAALAAPAPTTNLDYVERAMTDTVSIKGGSGPDNVGDVMTFTNPIFDAGNTKQVGTDQGYCVRMIVGKMWECHWTTKLSIGQIMVDGPVSDTGDTTLAITGGTGDYRGMRGEMLIHPRDPKATSYDFHFHLQ